MLIWVGQLWITIIVTQRAAKWGISFESCSSIVRFVWADTEVL